MYRRLFWRHAAPLLLLALPLGLAAQQSAAPAPAQVMVLGTFHFDNPGLDVVKTEVVDVLTPEKQREVEAVVEALALFRPTRILVEAPPEAAGRLDSLYRAYREGRHALSRNEAQQLGFRLAARLGLSGVHPIDVQGRFPFVPVMEYAGRREPEFVETVQRRLTEITAEENRRQRLSIAENLRLRNDPGEVARGHAMYLDFARVGAGDGYAGANLLSAWYDRNIRIFANLQKLATQGERVLVIYGSGHNAILSELVRSAAGIELVKANDYLPPG